MRRWAGWWYVITGAAVFLLDRASKYEAQLFCERRYELNDYVACEIVYNRGISWGFLHSESPLMFYTISLIIALVTCWVVYEALRYYYAGASVLGEVLVIAGSVGNLLDRVMYGGVLDFIELSYGEWVWPLFNIADVCIVLGVFLMIGERWQWDS